MVLLLFCPSLSLSFLCEQVSTTKAVGASERRRAANDERKNGE
jgi:hypothetical protein